MRNAKKIIFFALILAYSVLIVVLGSEIYLIGGSDVLEFVYSMPALTKAAITAGLVLFGYISFFKKNSNTAFKLFFGLAFILSILSSQSLVLSGKNNSIEYYILGIQINKIDLDPTEESNLVVETIVPGLTKISSMDMSLTYVSLFYPFTIDLSELQSF